MHAGEGIPEQNHDGSVAKGAQERSALPRTLKHGQPAQGPGRGLEGSLLPGLARAPSTVTRRSPRGRPRAEEQAQIVRFVEHPQDDPLALPRQGRRKLAPSVRHRGSGGKLSPLELGEIFLQGPLPRPTSKSMRWLWR